MLNIGISKIIFVDIAIAPTKHATTDSIRIIKPDTGKSMHAKAIRLNLYIEISFVINNINTVSKEQIMIDNSNGKTKAPTAQF
jgi:hypothetical protein